MPTGQRLPTARRRRRRRMGAHSSSSSSSKKTAATATSVTCSSGRAPPQTCPCLQPSRRTLTVALLVALPLWVLAVVVLQEAGLQASPHRDRASPNHASSSPTSHAPTTAQARARALAEWLAAALWRLAVPSSGTVVPASAAAGGPCLRHLTQGTGCLNRSQAALVGLRSANATARLLERQVAQQCRRPRVAWDAPIEGGLLAGMSNEAVAYLMPLSELTPLRLANTFREGSSFVAGLPPEEAGRLRHLKAQAGHGLGPPPDVYVSQWPPGMAGHKLSAFRDKDAVYRVGRAMYETTSIPDDWAPHLQRFDEIWTPTDWGKRVLVDVGLDPARVVVVPEGIDARAAFNPRGFSRPRARRTILPEAAHGHFVFLSVFKWEDRKAPTRLLKAFAQEFDEEEPVSLLMRTHPPRPIQAMLQDVAGRGHANVHVLGHLNQLDYHQMFVAADAFVLASHGEGWGRPIVEAMAMELPTIVTNWSGPTHFATDDNVFFLPVDKLDPVEGLPGASNQHSWAHISVERLRGLLRQVADDPVSAHKVGRRARAHILEHFDQDVVAADVLAHLQRACTAHRLGESRAARKQAAAAATHHDAQTRHQDGNWIYGAARSWALAGWEARS